MRKFKVRYYELETKDKYEFQTIKEEEIEADGYNYGHNDVNFFNKCNTNVAYFSKVILVKEIE